MRRPEQRRLEAALSRLDGSVATIGRDHIVELAGADGLDDLLGRLESVAARTGEAVEHQELVSWRLMAALDTLSVGVIVSDERGVETYRNRAAGGSGQPDGPGSAGAVGPAPEDPVGNGSGGGLVTGGVLAEQAVGEVLAAAGCGEPAERTLELFSPQRRHLHIRAHPITGPDGPLGAVAVVEDVSERRRVDAVRRDFVANVSHELKTPVGALSLLAETLDGEEDPEVVARLAEHVGMEVERLGRIIDDLLDLSRIETDEGHRAEPIDLLRLVEDSVGPLRATASARDITIEVSETISGLASLVGDRIDLVSAVSNLVDNAVKYSERDSCVQVHLAVDDREARVVVTDHGIGIPERDRKRIFERFFRVDRARSRLTGGTGLGLSIVRHVAVNHGGDVTVSSEEGRGSTFTLILPVTPGSGSARA